VQLYPGINECVSVLAVLDRSLVASCKDSIGWMFSKLDTNNDLYLDQAELAAINLDKYEVCIRPFFNSCDSYRDGKVSTAEWCLCFWRESKWSRDDVRVSFCVGSVFYSCEKYLKIILKLQGIIDNIYRRF